MCRIQSGLAGPLVTGSHGVLALVRSSIAASGGTCQGQHGPSLTALDIGHWESSPCLCTVLQRFSVCSHGHPSRGLT